MEVALLFNKDNIESQKNISTELAERVCQYLIDYDAAESIHLQTEPEADMAGKVSAHGIASINDGTTRDDMNQILAKAFQEAGKTEISITEYVANLEDGSDIPAVFIKLKLPENGW